MLNVLVKFHSNNSVDSIKGTSQLLQVVVFDSFRFFYYCIYGQRQSDDPTTSRYEDILELKAVLIEKFILL